MNDLARMWAEREAERRDRRALVKLIKEVNEAQAKMRPIVQENLARRRARMRQDGNSGFVMVSND